MMLINSTEFACIELEKCKLLSISEFIDRFGYDIDKLYIDRFWNNIQSNDWIIVDYDMLRWMGYTCDRDRNNRQKYITILKNNFYEEKEYKIVSASSIDKRYVEVAQSKVILVRSRQFKESLMLLYTERAKEIRRYYTLLEQILIDYINYEKLISTHNMSIEIKELRQLNQDNITFDVDPTPVKLKEYVYVLTNKRYYRQHMFKIGKTMNPRERLSSHNCTSATEDDELFYTDIIPTFDCSGLEKMLHSALASYKLNREWFKMPHTHMRSVIDLVLKQQQEMLTCVNSNLNDDFTKIQNIELNAFSTSKIEIAETDSIQDNHNDITKPKQPLVCPKCNKTYKSRLPYQKHIDTCNYSKPTNNSEYICDVCKTHFTTETRRNNHIEGGCPYHNKCEQCGHVFDALIKLKNHSKSCKHTQQVITNNKKNESSMVIRKGFDYMCSKCNKKCRSRGSAIKHYKQTH